MERSPSPKSMRRASSPPPASQQTPPQSQLRKTASSPSFCFLPCSLSELLLQQSPQSTPTPPRRCETEAHVAGVKKQTAMAGDSVPQLPFQDYTSGRWEPNLWSRSTQTELATESSTQTEPLAISTNGARLHENAFRWKPISHWTTTQFVVTVAVLGAFVFVLVVVATIFGAARAVTTTTVVKNRAATELHGSRKVPAKVRKATKAWHRRPAAREDARGPTFAPRKLPTTAGTGRRLWTPSPTMVRGWGVRIIGSHDYATRKDHLQEVTGELGMPSPIIERHDDNEISGEAADYGASPKMRKSRAPSATPAGDFVEEIV